MCGCCCRRDGHRAQVTDWECDSYLLDLGPARDRSALLAALAGLRPVLGTADAGTDAGRIEVDPAALRVVGVLATVAVHLAVAGIRVDAVDPAALVVPAHQARAAHRVVADLAAAADLVRTRPVSRGRRPSRRRPA